MSYGWAKLTGEYLAKVAYEKYGINSAVYRPFSGYGEDQDDAYPFPAICKRVLASKEGNAYIIWGSGDQSRDFIHIDDVVRGVITTMDKVNNGDAMNLSTGIGTTFKQFIKLVHKLNDDYGREPDIIGEPNKPEGVFYRVGCTKKQESLGFKAEIKFEEGIKRMLTHLQAENG